MTDSTMTLPELCELAACSPDFDVVYGFGRREAIEWLTRRLRLAGIGEGCAPADVIEAAYDAWPPKTDGVHIGTVRL